MSRSRGWSPSREDGYWNHDRRYHEKPFDYRGVDSYRPAAESRPRRDSQDDEQIPTGLRADRSRPAVPSRTASYASIPIQTNSTASESTTPTESPYSPRQLAETVQPHAARTNDPRQRNKWTKSNIKPIDINTSVATMDNTIPTTTPSGPFEAESTKRGFLANLVKEHVNQAHLERQLQTANVSLAFLRDQKEGYLKISNDKTAYRQTTSLCERQEKECDRLSAQVQESIVKMSKIEQNMPSKLHNVVRGVDEEGNQTLQREVVQLRAQLVAQTTLFNKMFEGVQAKLDLQEREIQDLRQAKHESNKVSELRNEVNKELKDAQSTNHAAIVTEKNILMEEIHKLDDAISSHDQAFKRCQQKLSKHDEALENQKESLDGHKETLNAHRGIISKIQGEMQEAKLESLEALQKVVKEHKHNFTNLSNEFVNNCDYKALASKVDGLSKRLTEEDHQELPKVDEPRVKAIEDQLEIHTSAIRRLSDQQDKLEQFNTTSAQDLIEMKARVQHMEKDHAAQSLPTVMPPHIMQRLQDIERKHNDFTNECKRILERELNNGFAKNQTLVNDVKQSISDYAKSIQGHEHAIKNLDYRYNSISTGELYKAIVSRLTPLGPKVDGLIDEITRHQTQITTIEGKSDHLQTQLNNLSTQAHRTDSELQTQLANLKAQLGKLREEIKATDGRHRASGIETKSLETKITHQSTDLQHLRSLIDALSRTAALMTSTDTFREWTRKIEQETQVLNDQISTLQTYSNTATASSLSQGTDITQFSKKLNDLRTILEGLEQAVGQRSTDISNIKGRITVLETNTDSPKQHDDRMTQLQFSLTSLKERVKDVVSSSTLTKDAETSTLPERVVELGDRLDDLIARINILEFSQDTAQQVESLRNQITPLTNAIQSIRDCLKQRLPIFDEASTFVKITQLASTVDAKMLIAKIAPLVANRIWFRGKKREDRKTDRYALVQVMNISTEAFKQQFGGQKWKGRELVVTEAEPAVLNELLFSKPDWPPEPIDPLPQPDLRASEFTISTRDDNSDTITVNSGNDILSGWNARTGPSSSPSRKPTLSTSRTNTPLSSATPVNRAQKRNAQALASSNSVTKGPAKRARKG